MRKVNDVIDKTNFTSYKCSKCGEELMTMSQLKEVAKKYRDDALLKRSKEGLEIVGS